MNVVSGKIRHRLVFCETQRLICGATRNRRSKREALSLAVRASVQPISERLRKVNGTRTSPVQAKRSVSYLIEEIQILDRRVIQAVRSTDAGFPRSAKDLAQHSVAEIRGVGKTKSWSEIVVSGWGKRFGNARIAWKYKTRGRARKHRGLLSLDPSLDLALRVIPGHAHFPAESHVQCEVRGCLP